jgi:hypothetical protein
MPMAEYKQVYRSALNPVRAELINTQEDMDWLREVHLPLLSKVYKSALIFGHEDCPMRIDCYSSEEPTVTDIPSTFLLVKEDEEDSDG